MGRTGTPRQYGFIPSIGATLRHPGKPIRTSGLTLNPPAAMSNEIQRAPESVEPWPTLASRPVGDFRIFTLRSDVKVSPRTGRQHDFYVIHSVDWVNVIALTPDRQHIVMVEQFRHGSNTIELEVPGGMMDPHEGDPLGTGIRELREETGYEGSHWRHLGVMHPCIGYSDERIEIFLATGLSHEGACHDEGEFLEIFTMSLADAEAAVLDGRITDDKTITALFWAARVLA